MAYPTEVDAVQLAPSGSSFLGSSSPTHTQLHDQYRAALLSIEDKIDSLRYESFQDHGNAGATETIDYAVARTHALTLDTSCTLSFTGWPASGSLGQIELWVYHDNTSNSRVVTWPAAVKFPFGNPPEMPTTTSGALTRFVLTTRDGGSTILLDKIGQEYA